MNRQKLAAPWQNEWIPKPSGSTSMNKRLFQGRLSTRFQNRSGCCSPYIPLLHLNGQLGHIDQFWKSCSNPFSITVNSTQMCHFWRHPVQDKWSNTFFLSLGTDNIELPMAKLCCLAIVQSQLDWHVIRMNPDMFVLYMKANEAPHQYKEGI